MATALKVVSLGNSNGVEHCVPKRHSMYVIAMSHPIKGEIKVSSGRFSIMKGYMQRFEGMSKLVCGQG